MPLLVTVCHYLPLFARHVRRKSFDDMLLNQIIESPIPSRHVQ